MNKLLLPSSGTKWKSTGYFMSLLNQVTSLRKLCLCSLLAIFAIQYVAQAQQLPTGNYADLTHVNGILYFTANNASGQSCLWKTDGTPAGTELVKNIGATSLTDVNGTLYFAANQYEKSLSQQDRTGGYELWKSDGTSAGTLKITDVNFGSWNSEYERPYPNILIKAGNTLLFTSGNSASGFVLNSTTGTKESIIPLTFISLLSDDPIYFAERNGILFFVHRGVNGDGNGLWKSDGSAAGTVRVKEIWNPNMLINVNGTLFFEATDQVNGDKLWKSDGTETGTILAQDIVPGVSDVYTTHLTNVNGTLFFTKNGNELWKSDGTSAGPVRIKTLTKKVTELAAVGNTLYFFTADTTGELWKSNGTTAGTVLVKNNMPSILSSTAQLTAVNTTLFFTTNNSFSGNGQKLWKSNGTPEGTIDIFAQPYYPDGVIDPQILANVNGIWYYTSNHYDRCSSYHDGYCLTSERGFQLWRSNGTVAGTIKIGDYGSSIDIEDRGPGTAPDAFIVVGNSLIFIGQRSPYQFSLEKIDNNATEPVTLREFFPNEYPNLQYFTLVNGTLFFTVDDEGFGGTAQGYGRELWKTDGTPAGTVLVKDIWPGIRSSGPAELKNENGLLYFTADDGSGRKLWKSDGTTAGTVPVLNANTCSASGSILREYWANVAGTAVSTIPVNTTPTSSSQLTSFEAPTNAGTNYGQRIRGYLCVPTSGNYTFYIAGDDNAELWLSTDEDPAKKVRIASINYFTGVREWTKYTSQKSASIALVAGKKYYIEALHKESLYGDNLAVAWILPNTSAIAVIPGSSLSPYVPTGSISREVWNNVPGSAVADIPLTTPPTSRSVLSSFETPSNQADNYGQRIRGYLHPVVSGQYQFLLAGDDNCELYLSTDQDPSKKVRIAHLSGPGGWSKPRQWLANSGIITLVAGRKYYIEALHKEGRYGDNLAVGWKLFSAPIETIEVIPGSRLSPYLPTATPAGRIGQGQDLQALQLNLYPNPFESKLTLQTSQQGKLFINVTDNLGRSVYQATHQVEASELEINLAKAGLKAGVYFVSIKAEDGQTKVVRVLKK